MSDNAVLILTIASMLAPQIVLLAWAMFTETGE